MKSSFVKTLLALALSIASVSAEAFQANDWNLHLGTGINGSRGLFGLSADYFFTEHHVLSTAVGVDVVGGTTTVGYKYVFGPLAKSKEFWDRCFFIFDCNTNFYLGASGQHAAPTQMMAYTNDVLVRQYDVGEKYFAIAHIGSRDTFKNNMTLDFEITYKHRLTGGAATQTLGTYDPDDEPALHYGFNGVGVGVGVGYLF